MSQHARPHHRTHTRSAGHSAVAGAAYRLGLRLYDERAKRWHDYRKRELGEEIVQEVQRRGRYVQDLKATIQSHRASLADLGEEEVSLQTLRSRSKEQLAKAVYGFVVLGAALGQPCWRRPQRVSVGG